MLLEVGIDRIGGLACLVQQPVQLGQLGPGLGAVQALRGGATSCNGRFWLSTGTRPMASSTSRPTLTLPNTVCLPASQSVSTRLMKNCEPLLFGPLLAMAMTPRTGMREIKRSEYW